MLTSSVVEARSDYNNIGNLRFGGGLNMVVVGPDIGNHGCIVGWRCTVSLSMPLWPTCRLPRCPLTPPTTIIVFAPLTLALRSFVTIFSWSK